MSHRGPVAVLGAGSIGVAFSILFARQGFDVRVYDPDPDAPARARADLAERLRALDSHGLLDRPAAEVAARIRFGSDVAAAAFGAVFVQECAPERVEIKQTLLQLVGDLTEPEVPLASSTSAIVPSAIAAGLSDEVSARVLVGHPGNPPYLLPVVEVVPSPVTAPAVVECALRTYRTAGLRPVLVRREVEGFVFNRLQGALLREAYCLLRDGVASVDDIDEVVRSGLGRRWSVIGPFETADLNTRGGLASHAEKMGPAYERMGAERGQHDPWTPELVATATEQRRKLLDLADWEARVHWRDEQLMRLQSGPVHAGARTAHQNARNALRGG